MVLQVEISKAIALLRQGEVVAFPTETVYGLGADATNPKALRKVFLAKQRPMDHPLIVHIGSEAELDMWVREIPEVAYPLMKAFWPGPLTLIFKKSPQVVDLITGGQDTVGLRMPNHPVALELLRAFGGGLAAPSANRFGRISPTTMSAVIDELEGSIAGVMEGGQCEVGVESTIVDLSHGEPRILRPGMITVSQIEKVLGKKISVDERDVPRVSGSLESHYAPETKMKLVATEEVVGFLKAYLLPVAVLSYSLPEFEQDNVKWVNMSSDAVQYAHDLYKCLRMLDKEKLALIVVEKIPESDEWDAVRDRLNRAAF